RTNPAYAAVYDNLGSIHARLASEAYAKALGRDIGSGDGADALAMVRDMQAHRAPSRAALPTLAALPAQSPALPPVVAQAVKPASPVAVTQAARPAPPPVVALAAKPASSAPPAPVADSGRAAVLAMVEAWARAWSARDVPAYLAF